MFIFHNYVAEMDAYNKPAKATSTAPTKAGKKRKAVVSHNPNISRFLTKITLQTSAAIIDDDDTSELETKVLSVIFYTLLASLSNFRP
jgi:hypothetical protein